MIDDALEAVRLGEVIGLPTDTVYGIGADPLNPEAVNRLFVLKGRPEHKPVGILVASVEQADILCSLDGEAKELAAAHWPGPLTLVAMPRVVMPDWVGDAQTRTIGVRVPNHPVALELLEASGPLAVTSANVSGGTEAMDEVEAREVFGDQIRIYLAGSATGGQPSTVVDVTGGEIRVLRKGPLRI